MAFSEMALAALAAFTAFGSFAFAAVMTVRLIWMDNSGKDSAAGRSKTLTRRGAFSR